MRRIVLAVATTGTAIVLLFSYHTSTNGTSAARTVTARTDTARTVTAGSARLAVHAASTSSTVTGDVAQTRWGPVQVSITVASRRITKAETVQVPTGNDRDAEINGVAVPLLNQEAVQAQSAQVDTVSGASVTSDGYRQSLQSAIDQANL